MTLVEAAGAWQKVKQLRLMRHKLWTEKQAILEKIIAALDKASIPVSKELRVLVDQMKKSKEEAEQTLLQIEQALGTAAGAEKNSPQYRFNERKV